MSDTEIKTMGECIGLGFSWQKIPFSIEEIDTTIPIDKKRIKSLVKDILIDTQCVWGHFPGSARLKVKTYRWKQHAASSSRFLKYTQRLRTIMRRIFPSSVADLRPTLNRLLECACGEWYVVRGSNWHKVLHEQIRTGSVKICERDEALRLCVEKKTFILLDWKEYASGIGKEMYTSVDTYPPGLLCIRHLHVFKAYYTFITDVAQCLNDTLHKDEKELIMCTGSSDLELLIADLLYALVPCLAALAKEPARRTNSMGHIYPLLWRDQLEEIDCDRYAFFVWNHWRCSTALRNTLVRNRQCDCYFLYGEKKRRSNACLGIHPFIVWGYANAGTHRFMPVFSTVTNYLGISGQEAGIYQFYDTYYREYPDDPLQSRAFGPLLHEPDGYCTAGRVVDLYRMIPHSSYIYIHSNFYHADEILEKTGSRMVVLIRDMRDVLLSLVSWYYGFLIRCGNISMRDIVWRYMTEDNYLDTLTRHLVEIKDHPNAVFIRYEDICHEPLVAYHRLLAHMGFADDPFWVNEPIDSLLQVEIQKALPENQARFRGEFRVAKRSKTPLLRGKPGGWRSVFDNDMVDWFKAHDNGYLQAFGYEKDTAWTVSGEEVRQIFVHT